MNYYCKEKQDQDQKMSLSELLPIIRSQFSKLKICGPQDKVYKDECVYSFDSPFSDGGLFVNMATFQGCLLHFCS